MLIVRVTILATLCALVSTGPVSFMRQRHLFPTGHKKPTIGRSFGHTSIDYDEKASAEVKRGGVVKKWEQTYNGIPVYGSIITTHHNEQGYIKSTQGSVLEHVNIKNSHQIINLSQATDSLKRHWGHLNINAFTERNDPAKLYVYPDSDGSDYLVYEASYFMASDDLLVYIKGIVRADTGEIVDTWNNLKHAKIDAIFGNRKIGEHTDFLDVKIKDRNRCYHVDSERRIEIVDYRKRNFLMRPSSKFNCDEADSGKWDFTNGAYSPRNDAYRNAQRFVDMWEELITDRDASYKNSGKNILIKTHYKSNSLAAKFFFRREEIVLADGTDESYPLVTLDIVCHELAHAMTDWLFGDLDYSGQSGAMNEAYSDIVGETCDMFYNGKNNYLIGDDMMKGEGEFYRDMCNPTRDGQSIDNINNYVDSMDAHHSSGIYNKAWCLLSKTPGWDYIKAFQVFTRANHIYWGKNVMMAEGVCGVQDAATDLGLSRYDVRYVFSQVGLSCSRTETVRL